MNEALVAIKEIADGFLKRIAELETENAALKAEVASLRIAQQANTAICPVSAMQCVRARVVVECQTPDAPCQHRGKQHKLSETSFCEMPLY
jgi:hypothetical protein